VKRSLALLVLVGCAALPVVAARWEEKPFWEWTLEEASAILRDSPWAREVPISIKTIVSEGGAPVIVRQPDCPATDCFAQLEGQTTSGESFHRSAPRLIQNQLGRFRVWSLTAKPVRMAMARLAVLTGELSEKEAEHVLSKEAFPGAIVIVVSAPRPEDWRTVNPSEKHLGDHSFLRLKRSNVQVPLFQYVSPLQSNSQNAFFVFPREFQGRDILQLGEEEIRFAVEFTADTKIEMSFNLEEMVFEGSLTL
jgi:hypothetical protein